MADRVIILVADDWELLGNGLGNVAHLQYLPSLFLMRLADELGMKVTFMAETLQQLAMRRVGREHREVRMQAQLWEENVSLMRERGHDVQLHLHAQWLGARYQDGAFRLGRNWNLATYDAATRRAALRESSDYLRGLLRPLDPAYTVNSFKAGSWGLQPSEGILRDLEAEGIRVVIGPGRAIVHRTPEFYADYAGMEEDLLPYHPDYADIRRVARGGSGVVVLPLPWISGGTGSLLRRTCRALFRLRGGGGERDRFVYMTPEAVRAAGPSPLVAPRRGVRGLRQALLGTHSLDVGSAPFAAMAPAMDQIMARCLRAEVPVVPLVIQSHTKGYEGRWDDVARLFRRLVDRYGRWIEFRTLSELQPLLPSLRVEGRAANAA